MIPFYYNSLSSFLLDFFVFKDFFDRNSWSKNSRKRRIYSCLFFDRNLSQPPELVINIFVTLERMKIFLSPSLSLFSLYLSPSLSLFSLYLSPSLSKRKKKDLFFWDGKQNKQVESKLILDSTKSSFSSSTQRERERDKEWGKGKRKKEWGKEKRRVKRKEERWWS